MWNPKNPKDLASFRDAFQDSRRKFGGLVKVHKEATELLVGNHFGDDEARPDSGPINLVEMATNIFERHVIPQPPQASIFTARSAFRPAGKAFEAILNEYLKTEGEIHKQWSLAVKASFFSIGIVKVGIEAQYVLDNRGFPVYRDVPYIKHISPSDWCQDMGAKSLLDLRYMGHRYSRPLADVLEDESLENTQGIQERDDSIDDAELSLSEFQNDRKATDYLPMCDLWDVWLRDEKLLVTFRGDMEGKPLKVVEWSKGAPANGPFHLLYYHTVDDSPIPLAPGSLWIDWHRDVNALYKKTRYQARRSKRILVTRGVDAEDAGSINKAVDGECVAVSEPGAVLEKAYGGFDQGNFALMESSIARFSMLNGNLEILGGLGAQSKTARQDTILNENSSLRPQRMGEKVLEFTGKTLRDYAYWMWTDPVVVLKAKVAIPGWQGDMPEVELTPRQRNHDFFCHEIQVEQYSMIQRTPQDRARALMEVVMTFFLPASQLMQQQGYQFDIREFVMTWSKYMNLPEVMQFIKMGGMDLDAGLGGPPAEEMQSQGGFPTERTYRRISESPGQSQENQTTQMVGQLMAAASQQGR